MQRQNEPLTEKKSWSEMTEKERQSIRESWKHTLPEKYDVYCLGDFPLAESHSIPGSLFVQGSIYQKYSKRNLKVYDTLYVCGCVEALNLSVGNDCVVEGDVFTILSSYIGNNLVVRGNVKSSFDLLVDGNIFVDGNISSENLRAKLIDCNNISPIYWHNCKIAVDELIFRSFDS